MPLDFTQFEEHSTGDSYGIFLKGHLWIESCLRRGIELSLKEPGAVDLDRMPFAQKVSLAVALGALESDAVDVVRMINKKRNRLAHDLAAEVKESDLTDLEGALKGAMLAAYPALRKEEFQTLEGRFVSLFYIVLWVLEYANMRLEFDKTHAKKLQAYRVLRALNDMTGAKQTPEELWAEQGLPERPDPMDAWTNNLGRDGQLRSLDPYRWENH